MTMTIRGWAALAVRRSALSGPKKDVVVPENLRSRGSTGPLGGLVVTNLTP